MNWRIGERVPVAAPKRLEPAASDPSQRRWRALVVRQHKEPAVARTLSAAGYDTYAPHCRVTRVHRGRNQEIIQAVFPTYLFAEIAQDDPWGQLLYVDGVKDIIRLGETLAPVPTPLIVALRARETAPEGFSARERVDWIMTAVEGELVRVTDRASAWFSFNAKFIERIDSPHSPVRIRALVELFGRWSPIEFARDQVEPV